MKLISVLILTMVLAISCKKDRTTDEDFSGVYIAGTQRDSITGIDRACYWKNGVITFNALPTGNSNYYANAIAINRGDVYTTGYANLASSWRCQVWKNGQHLYELGDAYCEGKALAIIGSDIYTGGQLLESSIRYALYWKNNSDVTMLGTATNNNPAFVHGFATSGTDLYAVGTIDNAGKVWKNGIEISLPNSTVSDLKAIAVSGNDIYITGNVGARTIRYWKNNTSTDITVPIGREIYVSGIAVENNDIYISGWESTGTVLIAKYWKNGTEVVLGDGIRHSYTGGIVVKNGKVYVAGNQVATGTSFPYYATLWEDGVAKVIGGRNSRATAIIVK